MDVGHPCPPKTKKLRMTAIAGKCKLLPELDAHHCSLQNVVTCTGRYFHCSFKENNGIFSLPLSIYCKHMNAALVHAANKEQLPPPMLPPVHASPSKTPHCSSIIRTTTEQVLFGWWIIHSFTILNVHAG